MTPKSRTLARALFKDGLKTTPTAEFYLVAKQLREDRGRGDRHKQYRNYKLKSCS